MATRDGLQGQCKRIMSALLPAAELLLRRTMDWMLENWQQRLTDSSKREIVEEARCTAITRPDLWRTYHSQNQ